MRLNELGVEFGIDQSPFNGYGHQNDYYTSWAFSGLLSLHFSDEPFPCYHLNGQGNEDRLIDIIKRLKSFSELQRPGTILFHEEIPLVIEMVGAGLERSRAALDEEADFDNPYSEFCSFATRQAISALQIQIGEEPLLPPDKTVAD